LLSAAILLNFLSQFSPGPAEKLSGLIRSALCTSGELAELDELDELAEADAELPLFVASFASIWASFASNALTVPSMVFPFTQKKSHRCHQM